MNDRPGEMLPEHRPDEIGAPFDVVLAWSATRDAEGATTIPDMKGLIAAVVMMRLWRDERLTGTELTFLRKSVGIGRDALGRAIGAGEEEIEGYEAGPRPMTIALEKYIRLHLFNAARRMDGPRVDEMINYLDWTLDEWRPTFAQVGEPIEIRLSHFPTGWQQVKAS
jgi:hypothetical protein